MRYRVLRSNSQLSSDFDHGNHFWWTSWNYQRNSPLNIKWNPNHADSKGAWFEFLPFATEMPSQRLSPQDQTLSSAKSAKSSSGEEEKEMQIRNWGEPVFLAEMQTEFQRRNASRGGGELGGISTVGWGTWGVCSSIFLFCTWGSYKKFCREAKSSKSEALHHFLFEEKTSTLKRWQLSCIFTSVPTIQ